MPSDSSAPVAGMYVGHRRRFAMVLAAALLLVVAQPLTSGFIADDRSFDIFFSLLIVAMLLRVFDEREHRRIALTMGVTAFLGLWLGHAVGGSAGRILVVAAHLVAASFFAFSLYGILRAIFVSRVSGDALFGAACGYLLLGIIWSLLYYAVETAAPGSFSLSSLRDAGVVAERLERSDLSYYSFITLATVGYGDVVPTTPLARTLAWTEAITGQFYLAVLVAGLVGFKVAQAMNG